MKKIVSLILILSLITLMSCTDQSAQIYFENMGSAEQGGDVVSESGDSDTDSTLSGTINISFLHAPDGFSWYRMAEEFQKIHPNVKIETNDTAVELDKLSVEEAMIAIEKYQDDLAVKMNSGDAPDLIISLGSSDGTEFIAGDLLYDINEFIENDTTFIKEDYFMNVIKAQEINGGLYNFPLEFDFSSVRIRQDVLEFFEIDESSIKTVDYNFLYDLYFNALNSGEFTSLQYINREEMTGKSMFTDESYASSFNADKMEVSFNSPEFIEYLNTTSRYESIGAPFGFFEVYEIPSLFDAHDILVEGVKPTQHNHEYLMGESENASKAYPVSTINGEITVGTTASVSIPANAKSPDLTWEFVKYLMAENDSPMFVDEEGHNDGLKFVGSIPINRKNLENYHKYMGAEYGASEESIDNFILYVNEVLTNPIRANFNFSQLMTPLNELHMDFYNGLMTAEECAEAMQERAEIYFAENS